MTPPSGLPPLRQNSVNFAGGRKAEGVKARIFEVAVAMREPLLIVGVVARSTCRGQPQPRLGSAPPIWSPCHRPSTAPRRARDCMRHQSEEQGCRAEARRDAVSPPRLKTWSADEGRDRMHAKTAAVNTRSRRQARSPSLGGELRPGWQPDPRIGEWFTDAFSWHASGTESVQKREPSPCRLRLHDVCNGEAERRPTPRQRGRGYDGTWSHDSWCSEAASGSGRRSAPGDRRLSSAMVTPNPNEAVSHEARGH